MSGEAVAAAVQASKEEASPGATDEARAELLHEGYDMSDSNVTDRLVRRLNLAADELASAARYGLPIPTVASVNGYDNLEGLALSLDCLSDFDAWADYASDVVVVEYEHDGARWHRATGTLGLEGLQVTFSVRLSLIPAVTA